jgi:hypothetical protein
MFHILIMSFLFSSMDIVWEINMQKKSGLNFFFLSAGLDLAAILCDRKLMSYNKKIFFFLQ